MKKRFFSKVFLVAAFAMSSLFATTAEDYVKTETGVTNIEGAAYLWSALAKKSLYGIEKAPRIGSILVINKTKVLDAENVAIGELPTGHLSIVTKLVDARNITVKHANLSTALKFDGKILTTFKIQDVSVKNDWSLVKLQYGTSGWTEANYPTLGFIATVPYKISVSYDKDDYVTVKWAKTSGNFKDVALYRRDCTTATWVKLANVLEGTDVYLDKTVVGGNRVYYYSLKSTLVNPANALKYSDYSDTFLGKVKSPYSVEFNKMMDMFTEDAVISGTNNTSVLEITEPLNATLISQLLNSTVTAVPGVITTLKASSTKNIDLANNTITRPLAGSKDVKVTLTMTAQLGAEKRTKAIKIVIKAEEAPAAE
jgi:hypothetical protein